MDNHTRHVIRWVGCQGDTSQRVVSGWRKFFSVWIPGHRLVIWSPPVPVHSPSPPSLLCVVCGTRDTSERIPRKGHESSEKIWPGTIVSPKNVLKDLVRIRFLRNCLSYRPVPESNDRLFPSKPVIVERWRSLSSRFRTLLLRVVKLTGTDFIMNDRWIES